MILFRVSIIATNPSALRQFAHDRFSKIEKFGPLMEQIYIYYADLQYATISGTILPKKNMEHLQTLRQALKHISTTTQTSGI
jgi:hypothetical protein